MSVQKYACVCWCVCAYIVKWFALGFRLSQLKVISLQLISKLSSFPPAATPDIRAPAAVNFLSLFLSLCNYALSMYDFVFMSVSSI